MKFLWVQLFLLSVGSFLNTVLQWSFFTYSCVWELVLLTVGASLLTVGAFLLAVGAFLLFLLTVGKCIC